MATRALPGGLGEAQWQGQIGPAVCLRTTTQSPGGWRQKRQGAPCCPVRKLNKLASEFGDGLPTTRTGAAMSTKDLQRMFHHTLRKAGIERAGSQISQLARAQAGSRTQPP